MICQSNNGASAVLLEIISSYDFEMSNREERGERCEAFRARKVP